MSNEAKDMAVGIVTSWATMTITEKKAVLEAKINAEIASTTSAWVKLRDQGYLMLLGYANDYLLNKINSYIK